MSMGLIFWVLMLLWFVFAMAWSWGWAPISSSGPWVNSVWLFILFLLLGWKVFGAPVHG